MPSSAEPPDTSGRLCDRLLDGRTRFNRAWLGQEGRVAAPLLSYGPRDKALLASMAGGVRAAGFDHLIGARVAAEHAHDALARVTPHPEGMPIPDGWGDTDVLLVLPDLSGAVFLSVERYALIGGSTGFVALCASASVDDARARFARHARKLAASHPILMDIAAGYPPRWHSWSSPGEAPAGSHTRQLVDLVEKLLRERITLREISAEWFRTRSAAMADGERVHGTLGELLDEVFYILDEEYVDDPALRSPGDPRDEEIVEKISLAWHRATSRP
ncbi:hypothetical protein [Streptosporangium sp. H16]|uniref:hypothetical protein n=1 Tax=Streptosporangium sp. H16 TaxID=3444184 RepID=UPI003F7A64D9